MKIKKFRYDKIQLSYNADKLFKEFLKYVEKNHLNPLKTYTLKEISNLIPYKRSNIKNTSTYDYSFMSMFASQKRRDYFNFVKPSVKQVLTEICNDTNRNNKEWEKKFSKEKVKINPKYIKDLWNKAYLMIYNPNNYIWHDIDNAIDDIKINGYHLESWSSGTRKDFEEGARVYLIQLGVEERGIFASGWINNSSYVDLHWDEDKAKQGLLTNYVEIEFDSIINPNQNNYLLKDTLELYFPEMRWSQRASGVEIIDVNLNELEELWSTYSYGDIELVRYRIDLLAEEVINSDKYVEGSTKKIFVNAYERNKKARDKCLEIHGYNCSVCGINMEEIYGELAKEFIHVHHVKPLAVIDEEYEVNPEFDLVPICPNCHAVIHRRKPAISINELKRIIGRVI